MRVGSLRSPRAQSILETVVGIIFLIPIVLFMFDVGILILANTANDNLAKQAARAAASAAPSPLPTDMDAARAGGYSAYRDAAKRAAERVVDKFSAGKTGGFMHDIAFTRMRYYNNTPEGPGGGPNEIDTNPGPGNVSVVTKMVVVLPVPFPGFDTRRTFYAKAVEPIVAIPPE